MTRKIAVVGFGAVGCRHAQSLLEDDSASSWRVYACDPDAENFRRGLHKIRAEEHSISYFRDIASLPDDIDLAIVATTASPRFNIMQRLLDKGVMNFLLEKIVFQSSSQFEVILRRIQDSGAEAYCNFVNRYFENYTRIRNEIFQLSGISVDMSVVGGEFGLGCNAIHYLDIFEYLTSSSSSLTIMTSLLEELHSGSRRGPQYREFSGCIEAGNDDVHRIRITSFPGFDAGVVVTLRLGESVIYQLNEKTCREVEYRDGEIRQREFRLLPTSRLTAQICSDILEENCRLSTIAATMSTHTELFRIFNAAAGLRQHPTTLCPIT